MIEWKNKKMQEIALPMTDNERVAGSSPAGGAKKRVT